MAGRKHHPCPSFLNTRGQNNHASHFHFGLHQKTRWMGLIFLSYFFILNSCIASGSDVPTLSQDLELNPLLLNFTQALQNSPFSKELEAASTNATICSSPSYTWSIARIGEMGYEKYQYLSNNYITIMPFIYCIYIDKSEEDEYFGTNGGQTVELLQRHDLAQNFWKSDNVEIENVLLLGAHGAIFSDPAKLIPTIMLMFPSMNTDQANDFYSEIYNVISSIPETFDNPLLSLNAIATPGGDILGTGEIFPAATVMGDGIIDKLIDINLGSNGPDFVHAHEVAHQVQFDLGVYNDNAEPSPTNTRDKELMADSLSAYFLSHDQGGDMDMMQILELHQTAFTIGDCSFDSKSHHGTPSQRRCASMWGASQAMNIGSAGIIDPATLRQNFENALHDIVSLSSDICPLPEEHDSIECSVEMVPITVKIKLDGFPSETAWVIRSNDDDTMYATKSYSKPDEFSIVYNVVCIHPQKEYTFSITDVHGDGIIDGYYNIFSGANETEPGSVLLLEGHGSFDSGTSAPFSLTLCPGKMAITVVIQLDKYAFETSWIIKGAADQVEYESASYTNDDKNSIVSETVCLHMEKDYTFTIMDSYGDGIINGFYRIYNGTNVTDEASLLVDGDGVFENALDVHFSPSLCPNKVPITINIQLDQYPFETSWALKTADDGVEFAGEWYLHEEKHSFVTEIACVEPGQQYEFSIEDRYGDGIINGFYEVLIDRSGGKDVLFEGEGNFGDAKSVEFVVV